MIGDITSNLPQASCDEMDDAWYRVRDPDSIVLERRQFLLDLGDERRPIILRNFRKANASRDRALHYRCISLCVLLHIDTYTR